MDKYVTKEQLADILYDVANAIPSKEMISHIATSLQEEYDAAVCAETTEANETKKG